MKVKEKILLLLFFWIALTITSASSTFAFCEKYRCNKTEDCPGRCGCNVPGICKWEEECERCNEACGDVNECGSCGSTKPCHGGPSTPTSTPTPTPIPPPATPAVSIACGSSDGTATLTFSSAGATSYNIRVDDLNGTAEPTVTYITGGSYPNNCGAGIPHDICYNGWTGSTVPINIDPLRTYNVWGEACNQSGCSPSSVGVKFQCPPTPTPTLTSTPTPTSSPTPTPTQPITPTVTSAPSSPFFQVQGGDIHAVQNNSSNNPLKSSIPTAASSLFFLGDILNDPNSAGLVTTNASPGHFPDLDPGGKLSPPNWYADSYLFSFSASGPGNPYDYSYFNTIITTPIQITQDAILAGSSINTATGVQTMTSSKNTWSINGKLTVNKLSDNLQSQVFLVSGDMSIEGDLIFSSLTNTFPVFIVQGDITVKPNVKEISGIFITDQSFTTEDSATPLVVHGGVIAYKPAASHKLNRARTSNQSEPSELFIYEPTYVVHLTNILGKFSHHWQEIQ